jgi:D-alanyl-D-alanine carboxypeptidase
MVRVGVARRSTRLVLWFLLCAFTAGTVIASTNPADARRRHHNNKRHAASAPYSPPYASIVVDAKTGKVLEAVNADASRFPASITKVMTLYLLFEALEDKRVNLSTDLRVSAKAAAQAPSKLGLRPGETIDVEDAIKAIVTKSANDVAMAIAENIGGSEERFASMMNRKARELGMKNTNFENPNGLPNPKQVTTARDLAILGRAIQERFPRQYQYFSTRKFTFRGRVIPSHNRLIGRVEGVDGIKTGYTRASGFNLLTSIRVDGRHLVGVVLGGKTSRWRDQRMADLLENNLDRAFTGRAIASALPQAERDERAAPPQATSTREAVSKEAAVPQPVERAKPAVVAELTRPAVEDKREAGQPLPLRPQSGSTAIRTMTAPVTASVTPTGPAMRWVAGPQGRPLAQHIAQGIDQRRPIPPGAVPYTNSITQRSVASLETQPLPKLADVKPAPAPEKVAVSEPAKPETTASIGKRATAAPKYRGWVIQLAATDDEAKAKDILDSAKSRIGRALKGAEPFTESIAKDGTTLYRARFAGFDDSGDAQAACRAAKKAGFRCFAQKV